MITLDQARRIADGQTSKSAIRATRPVAGPMPARPVSRGATQILDACLFFIIFISGFVFIEPSPYEFAIVPLAFACLIAGVTIQRELLPMIWLPLLWNIGGAIAYFQGGRQRSDGQGSSSLPCSRRCRRSSLRPCFPLDSVRRLHILRASLYHRCIAGPRRPASSNIQPDLGAPGELFAPGGRARGPFRATRTSMVSF